jgi:hypothetical protein
MSIYVMEQSVFLLPRKGLPLSAYLYLASPITETLKNDWMTYAKIQNELFLNIIKTLDFSKLGQSFQ